MTSVQEHKLNSAVLVREEIFEPLACDRIESRFLILEMQTIALLGLVEGAVTHHVEDLALSLHRFLEVIKTRNHHVNSHFFVRLSNELLQFSDLLLVPNGVVRTHPTLIHERIAVHNCHVGSLETPT